MPTLDELLALPAGLTLDTAIAEVAGHTVLRGVANDTYWIDNKAPDGRWMWLPAYSTTIAASWPLLAEMLAAGCGALFGVLSTGELTLQAGSRALRIREWDAQEVPTPTDAPLAIVRAWLSWKLGGAA